jgi:predicted hydrocarbon binding protein
METQESISSEEFVILTGEHTQEGNFDLIIKQIEGTTVKEIFFWCGYEYGPNGNIGLKECQKLNSFCENNNIKFYFIFSTNDNEYYKNLQQYNQSNLRILYWPTHLLHYTHHCLTQKFNPIGNVRNNFEKIFLNFNNRPHYHRCLTVDKLFENGLNEYGKISWNNFSEKYFCNHSNNSYKFKFWEESIMKVDSYTFNDITDELLETDTFMSLVSESTDKLFFVTEKTFKSILIGQIFYCVGGKGQNLKLRQFGFKLYDDLFDYTFDMKDSLEERVDGAIKNIKNLIGKDLYELHTKVQEVIEFNKNRALEIVKDDPYIPAKFMEMFKKFPNKFYESKILNKTLEYNLSQQL